MLVQQRCQRLAQQRGLGGLGVSASDSLRPARGGRLQPASSRVRTSAWVAARARRSRGMVRSVFVVVSAASV